MLSVVTKKGNLNDDKNSIQNRSENNILMIRELYTNSSTNDPWIKKFRCLLNERQRERNNDLKKAFEDLENVLPKVSYRSCKRKKLSSKIDIITRAINHIKYLEDLLAEQEELT